MGLRGLLEALCFQGLTFADIYSDWCLVPANGKKGVFTECETRLSNAGRVEVCAFLPFRDETAKGWAPGSFF